MSTESQLNPISELFNQLSEHYADSVLADLVKCDKRFISKMRKDQKVPVIEALKLLSSLGVTYESIMDGNVNISCIIKRLSGKEYIHPKYMVGRLSNSHNASGLISLIEALTDSQTADEILNSVQTSRSILSGSAFHVSPNLASDIIEHIVQRFSWMSHETLGRLMFMNSKTTEFHQTFVGMSPREAYEKLIDEVFFHIEASHKYRIEKLDNDGVTIRKYPVPELQDITGAKVYWNPSITNYQAGFVAAIPAIGNLGSAAIVTSINYASKDREFCELRLAF